MLTYRHRTALAAGLAVVVLAAGATQTVAAQATDDDVLRAIEKAKEYLINQEKGGRWPENTYTRNINTGHTAMAVLTLVYIGVHPNQGAVERGLDQIMNEPDRWTYVTSLHIQALAQVLKQKLLIGKERDRVREVLIQKTLWLVLAQGSHGGWDYFPLNGGEGRFDFSNTQLAILGLREAALAGVEVPDYVWKRTQKLYFDRQNDDGGWGYQNKGKSHGSMTAAGLASIFIIWDNLTLGEGCPCVNGKSSRTEDETAKRVEQALNWMSQNYTPNNNPGMPNRWHYYWLYSAERVGKAAGYKYFGDHDWYKEGVQYLLGRQKGGSWGDIPDTCFATMFLFKGRAPILYNKLRFTGAWDNHRRDIANLTTYIELDKEQPIDWQIVNLRQPVEELHDAPVLFITAESVPEFTPEEKKKLREFTDTGGTILFEPSCGNRPVVTWFRKLAEELWPEWRLGPLGTEHGVYTFPTRLSKRPELLGIDDGIRTSVYFAIDDISCPWHTKAYAAKKYMFDWGINLFTVAMDKSPLRAKLAGREDDKTEKFTEPIKAGTKTTLRIARVKHDGNWEANANYQGFDRLAKDLATKAGIALEVTEPKAVPFSEGGVPVGELSGYDAAYITGTKPFALTPAEQKGLKDYADGGGFLWFEAAMGSSDFNESLKTLAAASGWQLKILPLTDPLMTGRLGAGLGYDLTKGLEFRRVLQIAKLGRQYADIVGIYSGNRLIGIYSPVDVMFSVSPYDAYACKGYRPRDAKAVATNIVLSLTTRAK